MKKEIFNGSCHIATLAQNGDAQAFDFYTKVPRSEFNGNYYDGFTLTCTIDYPLKKSYTFKVEMYDSMFNDKFVKVSIVPIALQVAEQYQKLWNENESLFEGHHIGDLYIESMAIDNGELIVEVGS